MPAQSLSSVNCSVLDVTEKRELWAVRVDGMTTDELAFFGFVLISEDEEFEHYWDPRYNEAHVLPKEPPRYLMVDDLNDAIAIRRGLDPLLSITGLR